MNRPHRFQEPLNRLRHRSVQALVGLVGKAHALEILLEGRVFGAKEALDKGLVTRVLPDDEVAAAAFASARRIASGAPLVNRWHKQFINRVHASGATVGGSFTAEEQAEGFACFGTADYRVSHTISTFWRLAQHCLVHNATFALNPFVFDSVPTSLLTSRANECRRGTKHF